MQEGWDGVNNPTQKVPYKTQLAQWELNSMIAKTFNTQQGKKTLEYMKQMTIYRKVQNEAFTANGQPLLAYEAGMRNFVLNLMSMVEAAKQGPPKPPEENKNA